MEKSIEQYIEHEVQLRLHEHRFQNLDKAIDRLDSSMKHLDNKLTWAVGTFIAISIVSYMIPIALHFMRLS